MCKKLICLVAFIFVLGVASNASAELVAQWKFDEGTGTVAMDATGNGNDGTLEDDPTWVEGQFGQALAFDGSRVTILASDTLTGDLFQGTFTLSAWIKPTLTGNTWQQVFRSMIVAGTSNDTLFVNNDGRLSWRGRVGGAWAGGMCETDPGVAPANEWTHAAVTGDGTNFRIYVNGELSQESAFQKTDGSNTIFYIGGDPPTTGESYAGAADDVRLYNHVLTQDDVKSSMQNEGSAIVKAYSPDPKDGAVNSATWVTLSWKPGDFAVSHDVYIGDDRDEVSEATTDSNVFRGNQTGLFILAGFPGYPYPDGLETGTTYYWRIDEVNEAEPNSPWKGDVWSFSIPPKTAYDPVPADGAEGIGPDNVTLTWTGGFGAKLHTVYFGDSYDAVNDATGGAPSGTTSYKPGVLESAKVYYWRVDEFDSVATYKGEIWSFTTPGAVSGPKPAYGATDVGMNATLSWTPADSAASHQLYFGTDKDAVRSADTSAPEYKGSKALGAESYDPGLLDADTSYYWRVDEVDGQGKVSTGPLWLFTTGAYLLVDDFESYTDDDPNGQAIWQTWIDGFGVADNGAQAGYLIPPYAEQTIVHGGSQSMPLLYVNEAGVTNSEASMTLTSPRDWTQAGVAELSLWFRGAAGNAAEPLYVSIANSAGTPAVVANDDPEAATVRSWTQWTIPLQAFADQGVDLSNVNVIAIGLGTKGNVAAPGGSGTMYIDDIRLDQ
jgi:Concanavalin A-like lectin/glucanases superfamily